MGMSTLFSNFSGFSNGPYQASSFDVPWDLVRISVGLEDAQDLVGRMERALRAVQEKREEQST